MPFFGSKFSPKKAPQRKSVTESPRDNLSQLLSDDRTIQLNLGEQQFVFDNGDWIPGKTNNTYLRTTYKIFFSNFD